MKHSFLVEVVEVAHIRKTRWVTLEGPDNTDWQAQVRNVAQLGRTDDDRIMFATGLASTSPADTQEVVVHSIDLVDGEAGMELTDPQWIVTCPACSEVIDCKGVDGQLIKCPDCGFAFNSVG